MGAGINAYAQGAKMGITAVNTVSYDHTDNVATMDIFTASARNTRSFASGHSLNTSYSAQQRKKAGDRFAPTELSIAPNAPRKTVADFSL
jgi:hypothetical protein